MATKPPPRIVDIIARTTPEVVSVPSASPSLEVLVKDPSENPSVCNPFSFWFLSDLNLSSLLLAFCGLFCSI